MTCWRAGEQVGVQGDSRLRRRRGGRNWCAPNALARLAEVENRAAWSSHPNQDRELSLDSESTRMGHFLFSSVSGGRFGGLIGRLNRKGFGPDMVVGAIVVGVANLVWASVYDRTRRRP
jgi:hypothetical protein